MVKHSAPNSNMCVLGRGAGEEGVVVPQPPNNTSIPVGCPTIQLNSLYPPPKDSITSHRLRTQPYKTSIVLASYFSYEMLED